MSLVQEQEKRFPWQVFLYVVLISFLFVIYVVGWFGDEPKYSVLQAFLYMWFLSCPILLAVTFATYKSTFPFGNYPRHFSLLLSCVLGLGAALGLIGLTWFTQNYLGGLGLIAVPGVVEDLVYFFSRLPKLQFKPVQLDWLSGVAAIGWQAIVSGVEEGFKLAFTLGIALILYVLWLRRSGEVSLNERRVILVVAVVLVGGTWDGLHGFHMYSHFSEYLIAFVGLSVMSVLTFATGSIFPAFFMHFFFNVLGPALSAQVLQFLRLFGG